jgi:hypothetical protein
MKLLKIILLFTSSIALAGNGSGTMKAMKAIDDSFANSRISSVESIGLMFQNDSGTATVFAVARKNASTWTVNQFKVQNEELGRFNHLQEAVINSRDIGDWVLIKK